MTTANVEADNPDFYNMRSWRVVTEGLFSWGNITYTGVMEPFSLQAGRMSARFLVL